MLIEIPYMTCYLTAIVLFSKSVKISKIYIVKICMILILTFRMGQGQM